MRAHAPYGAVGIMINGVTHDGGGLLVGSVTTPNPTMVGGTRLLAASTPATGILRVTRHPMLWSFALWAATHMIIIGRLGGAIFTGAFLVVVVAGMSSLDV